MSARRENRKGPKKPFAKACIAADLEAMARKSADFEEAVKEILDSTDDAPDAQSSQKRRRVTRKSSTTDAQIAYVNVEVSYTYKEIPGRLFCTITACQRLPRRALKHLVNQTVDLEIKNAVFVITRSLVTRLGLADEVADQSLRGKPCPHIATCLIMCCLSVLVICCLGR